MPNADHVIANHYNRLPSVFDADAALDIKDRNKTLRTLGLVIKRHGLEDRLGLRLLHRHNAIRDCEIMFETAEFDDSGAFTLVSQPERVSANQAQCIATNSWIFVGQYIPIEFSDRRLLVSPEVSPATEGICFDELSEALLDLKVHSLIGPALLNGTAVESYRPVEDAVLLEDSDEQLRRNVCRFVSWHDINGNSVETFWDVNDVIEASTPPRPKPTPTKKCRRVCPYVRPGVHKGVFSHQPE